MLARSKGRDSAADKSILPQDPFRRCSIVFSTGPQIGFSPLITTSYAPSYVYPKPLKMKLVLNCQILCNNPAVVFKEDMLSFI